ncbi:Alg9-like mannosyltransferase family-domain-containing protein [Ganoderma leucocontextum]|nr:Alg9-like mannosyltransferase family-domain-containing protein [Ganoderma leucocontextum]
MHNFWQRKLLEVYIGLVFLRLCFALFGTGYIHPDEYFQNGEAIASQTLDLHTWLTWEWDPFFPCRSIVPVWVTTGVPFSILRVFSRGQFYLGPKLNVSLLSGGPPSPRAIFAAERLSFLGSSFLLDYVVYHLSYESSRMFALVLLGSSYVVHTYQVRPFSNSIESIFLAVSLLLLRKLLVVESLRSLSKTGAGYLAMLACVTVCGLFTRITFAAFFLPVALEVLKWSLRQSRFSISVWTRLIAPSLLVAITAAIGFVCADTAYFARPQESNLDPLRAVEVTPLNFLRYNLLPSNLAQHGLHPRWLHLVVNFPMIVTPALLLYVFWAELDHTYPRTAEKSKEEDKVKLGVIETMQKVLNWVRWSGTTLLSIQPHQEPRFLIPLVAPMVALVVGNGRILRAGKLFWVTWIVSNVVLAVLFGILHQGGVVPSLFRVHDIVYDPATGLTAHDYRVVYWKTYMPPRHLLAVRQSDHASKAVEVFDFSGAPGDKVVQGLRRPPPTSRPLTTLLVVPFHSISELEEPARACLTEHDRIFPHLDLDHLSEAIEVGWKDGLSLGIFEVDQTCLHSTVSS